MMKELENTIPENDNIIVYRLTETLTDLQVRIENDTVWLNRQQLALLFDRDVKTIGKHINNSLKEELFGLPVVANFATTAADGKIYQVSYYNLDMILSIGYRVKSSAGIQFRIWANDVLKNYMMKGYAISNRFVQLENRVCAAELRIESIIQQALPPKQGIFYDGQIFDAFNFVSDLVRSAKRRIVLIDNYVDDSVLAMLDARDEAVSMDIYTCITPQLKLANKRHTAQYPKKSVRIHDFRFSHDRWLLIDDSVYLFGASLKDLGKKWFGFALLQDVGVDEIMGRIKSSR